MKKTNILSTLLFVALSSLPALVVAQQTLTLDQCRQRALTANHDIRISEEKVAAAENLKSAALCQFFPKVSANGAYVWNQKNVQLLSQEQQDEINHMGDGAMNHMSPSIMNLYATLMQTNPQMAQLLLQTFSEMDLGGYLNAQGQSITDALNMDISNIYVGAVTVSQPIYMGGKIRAAYKAASLYNDVAHLQCDQERENQLIAVDQAFWQVVSLEHKQRLAQQYYDLLRQLSSDVDAMVAAEVATKADQTKVHVKLNEAEMSLAKTTNGLALSRMLLNQMCGYPLDNVYALVEDTSLLRYRPLDTLDMATVRNSRSELQMLRLSEGIAQAGVKMATSALLPNVVATGGYMVSNPNLYDGYSKEFGGSFMASVVVNIPICHPDAIYSVKAAQHKRNEARIRLEQAEEKIELQVNKLNYELEVANRKLTQAQSNLLNAEENLNNANESFKAGVISSGDLMQAQTAWMSAGAEVIDAEIEIRMDHLYLMQALGRSH